MSREQRGQTGLVAKTLWAAGSFKLHGVGSALAARSGGCAALAALATLKIPGRRTPFNFQTGAQAAAPTRRLTAARFPMAQLPHIIYLSHHYD